MSASSHGILGPTRQHVVRRQSASIRRIAAVSVAATPPRQILGVSLPSTGIRANFGAAAVEIRGGDRAATAAAPTACSNRRRDKAGIFMRREDIGGGLRGKRIGGPRNQTTETRRHGDARRIDFHFQKVAPVLGTRTRQITRSETGSGRVGAARRPEAGHAATSVRLRAFVPPWSNLFRRRSYNFGGVTASAATMNRQRARSALNRGSAR